MLHRLATFTRTVSILTEEIDYRLWRLCTRSNARVVDASLLRTSSMMRDSAGLVTLVRSTSMGLRGVSTRTSERGNSLLSMSIPSGNGSENRLYVSLKFKENSYFFLIKTMCYVFYKKRRQKLVKKKILN